jgi:membrane associated rhomboid family serine protease
MASFWDNMHTRFNNGNAMIRLLFINIAVFLILRVLLVFFSLFKLGDAIFLSFIQMPSDLHSLVLSPWTVITYMFVHLDLMHILFNMLWLYFFGSMFLRWFSDRQLMLLYILGGLFGALFFSLFYNLLPAFQGLDASLMGASASILALGVGVSIYKPDEPVPLFIFGVIKLKWLAIAMVVMDVLNLNGDNAGGNLAHLGGALAGLLFGLMLRKNPRLSLEGFFKKKPKMKVTYQRPKNEQANRYADVDQAYRDRKKDDAERLDAILDKIKKSGYDSLSTQEKQFLFESSRSH